MKNTKQLKTLDNLVSEKVKETEIEQKKEQEALMSQLENQVVPKPGDTLVGKVIEMSKNAVYIDLGQYGIGVVRGKELWESLDVYGELNVGDEVEATILEMENEENILELTFRKATKKEVWDELNEKRDKREIITVKIQSANKGGLLTTLFGIPAFMPVSQLTPEHYPRVEGGDQDKILSKLQSFIGKKMKIQIVTADPKDEKLIISEKEAAFTKQKEKIGNVKVGDVVEGEVSGIVDFGIFVKFDGLEGLVHISELSWQRVDDPANLVKIGDKVKAEIIGIEDSKITLSIKKLQKDPWIEAVKKYKVGQLVKGIVKEVKPFGIFIQLDKDIHGLVHVSELPFNITDAKKELVMGSEKEFRILSIEPGEHRLGLTLKLDSEKKEEVAEEKEEKKEVKKDKKEEKPSEKKKDKEKKESKK
ncbi:MAG: S1 RNA-binding domain-containing protein [Patescibacteria group bacterium]|nr:S1 RNA-binding domain-containing protein [Patescibacteria group bacterium]